MSKNYFGGLYDFSDVLFLREPLPLRMVYDVTAKFAQEMIDTLDYWTTEKRISHEEYLRLCRHIERYKEIRDRHTTYEPDPSAGTKYAGSIRYSYK